MWRMALLAVLLMAGTGKAGELEKVKPGDTILFMPGTYDKEHPPTLAPKEFQCYQRMQGAMATMNNWVKLGPLEKAATHNGPAYKVILEMWEKTMQECVR